MFAWMMNEDTYNPLESTAIDINGPLCVSIFTNGSLTVGLHSVTLPKETERERDDKIDKASFRMLSGNFILA